MTKYKSELPLVWVSLCQSGLWLSQTYSVLVGIRIDLFTW